MTTAPRGVEERIRWMLDNPPGRPGMCARTCWHALGGDRGNPPRWFAADANAVYDKVRASGRYFTTPPPRGALVVWQYGQHGHTALALGDGTIVTTDPTGKPGGTGIEPFGYPAKWGARGYLWTDQYNGVRFPVGGDGMGTIDYKYLGKPDGTQRVGTKYTQLQQSRWDPPRKGLEHTLVYLNIGAVKGAGKLRLRIVRANGDDTGYMEWKVDGPRLLTYTYFELGDGNPTHVELRCLDGLQEVTLGTRYTKKAVVID